ncbi:MAG: P-II family nitrogen regulator [Gammaproteobacteria bacterium]|nr:P-II family nitrogen regulator [Gammaproteobacteria bacterium]
MKYKKITAIISVLKVEDVEERLKHMNVPGMCISTTEGFGETRNSYFGDCMSEHARVEVIIEAERAEEIVNGIMDAAYVGKLGGGIVMVAPLEAVYRIRTKEAL